MSTVTFSQESAPHQPHQQADDGPRSDSVNPLRVKATKQKRLFPKRVALAGVAGAALLALTSQQMLNNAGASRKSQQVKTPSVPHAPLVEKSEFVGHVPQMPSPLVTLPNAPPTVDAAAAIEEGRAAVAQICQDLQECNRQSSSRRLETFSKMFPGFTFACYVIAVLAGLGCVKSFEYFKPPVSGILSIVLFYVMCGVLFGGYYHVAKNKPSKPNRYYDEISNYNKFLDKLKYVNKCGKKNDAMQVSATDDLGAPSTSHQ
eukprot:GHVT01007493.1.p1 GENE.GHVT01007493.1~~GHVT01007493.1.p1  ORF type:complete len:260 (+),score=26.81 GHVT01007493.1:323-1102(+)